MHERRLVGGLADAVGRAAGDDVARVTQVRVLVGALAAVDPSGLRAGLGDLVQGRWGATPDIVVETAGDGASDEVRLVGVTVGG